MVAKWKREVLGKQHALFVAEKVYKQHGLNKFLNKSRTIYHFQITTKYIKNNQLSKLQNPKDCYPKEKTKWKLREMTGYCSNSPVLTHVLKQKF